MPDGGGSGVTRARICGSQARGDDVRLRCDLGVRDTGAAPSDEDQPLVVERRDG
jgi:hypothetical protein